MHGNDLCVVAKCVRTRRIARTGLCRECRGGFRLRIPVDDRYTGARSVQYSAGRFPSEMSFMRKLSLLAVVSAVALASTVACRDSSSGDDGVTPDSTVNSD